MKLIVTFLLSVFFLLVRGNNHLYAHTHQNRVCYTPAKLSKSELASVSVEESKQTITGKATSSGLSNDLPDATELDDEDDFNASRKFVEITNYFLSFFYDQLFGDSSRYTKNRLPVCKHFSYSSSSKYLVQRVIRI